MTEGNKTNWTKVITFYIIACAISWPFYALRDIYADVWASLGIPNAVRNLGLMWGPGISAIICFRIFRKNHIRTISFTGTSALYSLAFYILPYIVWFVLTLINPEGGIKPSFFLILIPFGFLMILGEELGWRGFLQDALRNVEEWKKWLILGLMWEFWHFTNMMMGKDLITMIKIKLIRIAAVLVLTYIIGKLTDKTKSLMVAITLHSWANVQFEFTHINTQIAGCISLGIWAILIWKWNSQKTSENFKLLEKS